MDGGDRDRRTPYERVQQLVGWALVNWEDVNGRALRTGCRLLDLTADECLDVVYSLMLDDLHSVIVLGQDQKGKPVTHTIDRGDLRRRLDEQLDTAGTADHPNRETWGLRPEHLAAQGNVDAFGSDS